MKSFNNVEFCKLPGTGCHVLGFYWLTKVCVMHSPTGASGGQWDAEREEVRE